MRIKNKKKVLPILLVLAVGGGIYLSGSTSLLSSKPRKSTAPIPTIRLLTPTPTLTPLSQAPTRK